MFRLLKYLMIILAMLIFYKQHGYAQCPFTATVNTTTPILCPNTSAVITTQTYDAYQWYRDGAVLPGETNPTPDPVYAYQLNAQTGAISLVGTYAAGVDATCIAIAGSNP